MSKRAFGPNTQPNCGARGSDDGLTASTAALALPGPGLTAAVAGFGVGWLA